MGIEPEDRCPICHSPLKFGLLRSAEEENQLLTDAEIEELRLRGVYVWTDDPILTERGLAGDDYKGFTQAHWHHLKELQEARQQQEIDAGIPENERTVFSELVEKEADSTKIISFTKQQVEQLRKSTEKILKALGITKDDNGTQIADLKTYFNYDEDGNYLGTWKYGTKVDDKEEWSRIDRETGQPSLPSKDSNPPQSYNWIRALDIEELRHPISIPFQIGIFSDEYGRYTDEQSRRRIFQEADFYTYQGTGFSPRKHHEYNQGFVTLNSETPNSHKTSDKTHFWILRPDYDSIARYNWNNDSKAFFNITNRIGDENMVGMFSDGIWLWLITKKDEDVKVYTIDTDTLVHDYIGTIVFSSIESGKEYVYLPVALSMDKSFFYIMQTFQGDLGTEPESVQNIQKIEKPLPQDEVLSKAETSPPEEPKVGDRYLIITPEEVSGNEWLNHDNEITEYTASGWIYDIPANKWLVNVKDEDKKYFFVKEEEWVEWLEELEYVQLRNIETEDNKASNDNFPLLDISNGRVDTRDPALRCGTFYGGTSYNCIGQLVLRINEGCFAWTENGLEFGGTSTVPCPIGDDVIIPVVRNGTPYSDVDVNDETWRCIGSDNKHIYFHKQINKVSWGLCNEREYENITSEKSYENYDSELIFNKIIRISKETLEIDLGWELEASEIVGEGREYSGTCPNPYLLEQEIITTAVDKANLYFLCSDVTTIHKEGQTTIKCNFPECSSVTAGKKVSIKSAFTGTPYWGHLVCPNWYEENGDVKDFGETDVFERLPVGFVKVFTKGDVASGETKLVGEFNQQIGNFNEADLQSSEILEDKELDFDSYKRHLDDNNLDSLAYYLTMGSTAQEDYARNDPLYLLES